MAETFCTLGVLYGAIMATAAAAHRVPPEGYRPAGYEPSLDEQSKASRHVELDVVLKTPQFWMLFSVVTCNAIAGVSVVSTGKDIMLDIFGKAPETSLIVTGAFAATYVGALSALNMAGRLG